MINPGTRLRYEHSFEMLLATDLGQVSRVILVLTKADLNPFKWGNFGVTPDMHPLWLSHSSKKKSFQVIII